MMTLDEVLANASAETVFNFGAEHMLTQNEKAMAPLEEGRPDMCVYRAPNGKKCPGGAFIPDEAYKPHYENNPIYTVLLMAAQDGEDWAKTLLPYGKNILIDLQKIHDSYPTDSWPEILRGMSIDYDLKVNEDSKLAQWIASHQDV